MSNKSEVLQLLKERKKIRVGDICDSLLYRHLYHRISARIDDLKKEGYNIVGKSTGKGYRNYEYTLWG